MPWPSRTIGQVALFIESSPDRTHSLCRLSHLNRFSTVFVQTIYVQTEFLLSLTQACTAMDPTAGNSSKSGLTETGERSEKADSAPSLTYSSADHLQEMLAHSSTSMPTLPFCADFQPTELSPTKVSGIQLVACVCANA